MKNYGKLRNFLLTSVPVLAAFAALASAVWGAGQRRKAKEFEQIAELYMTVCTSSCARCANELSSRADEAEAALTALRVTSSPRVQAAALDDIALSFSAAASILSRLPCPVAESGGRSAFFTRAADYARSLSERLRMGETLPEEERGQLEAVLSSCRAVAENVRNGLENGTLPTGLEDLDLYADTEAAGETYPILHYLGPYAQNEAAPRALTGDEASQEEAESAAERIAGFRIPLTGQTEGPIPTYDFEGGGVALSLTRSGLIPLHIGRDPGPASDSAPEPASLRALAEAANSLIASLGFSDMAPESAEAEPGSARITFVRVENGVPVLADSVTVTVDAETRELISLDSAEYVKNASERQVPLPFVSCEEALKAVSPGLKITSSRLVFTGFGRAEYLCWEFRGEAEGEAFSVFVSAQTGEELLCRRLENAKNTVLF